jgi:nitrilase
VLGGRDADKLKVRERDGAGPIQDFLAETARKTRSGLVGGTVPIECSDAARVRNACLVFDDAGSRIARYDKIHLFAYRGENERYDETRTIEPGDEPLAIASPFGRLGLSVCYDLRFPSCTGASATSTAGSCRRRSPRRPALRTGRPSCAREP